jgi:membrane protease YdiL (CAAX protease family)
MADLPDLAFAGVYFLLAPLLDWLVLWPRFVAAARAGAPRARLICYRVAIALEWLATALAVALWARAGRPWRELGLVVPEGWRLVAGLAPALAIVALARAQQKAIAGLALERRRAAGARLGSLGLLTPRSDVEARWFSALSVSAGFCEELLYRGYLQWVVRGWLPAGGAACVVIVLFGGAHVYQGRSGALRATLVGAVFGGLALLTRSILPSILLHALVDLCSGAAGRALLHDDAPRPRAVP